MSIYVDVAVEAVTVSEVVIEPRKGSVPAEEVLTGFPIHSTPDGLVTGYDVCEALLKVGGSPILSPDIPKDEWEAAIAEFAGNPKFWIAARNDRDLIEEIKNITGDSSLNIATDATNGWSNDSILMTHFLAKQPTVIGIMSGPVATILAALDMQTSGCTHIRVGINSNGVGFPHLTAVAQIAQRLTTSKVVADCQIQTPAEAVKYLAAGANSIMLDIPFAYVRESRGWVQDGWIETIPQASVVRFPLPDPTPKLVRDGIQWDGATTASVVASYRTGACKALALLGCRTDEFITNQSKFIRTKQGETYG